MIHLSNDMNDSIANNYIDILNKYNVYCKLPSINVDEQNDVLHIETFAMIDDDLWFTIRYSYPFGLEVRDLEVCASNSEFSIKTLSKFIKNICKIRIKIDNMVIPYIKEEF